MSQPPTRDPRARAAAADGHVPVPVVELGYSRDRCGKCETDWPCPTIAQARVDDIDAEVTALYGLADAEELYRDPAHVWESELEPHLEPGTSGDTVIEQWTVHPPVDHLPAPALIVEWILEWTGDQGEVTDGWPDHTPPPDDPALVAAAEQLRQAIADRVTYRMGKTVVAQHRLAWGPDDDDGDRAPTLDGVPLYRPTGLPD